MSRNLFVIALDLERLHAVHGSGDRRLLQKILRTNSQQIVDHDGYWEKKVDSYLPISDAIWQLIDGKIENDRRPLFQFEHAVALIVDTLGESLDSTVFMESNSAFWEEVDFVIQLRRRKARIAKSVWPTLKELLRRGPFIRVPLGRVMRLGTGFMTAEGVCQALDAITHVDLASCEGLDELTWRDAAVEAVDQYSGWLRQGAAKKTGLFFHC